MKSSAKDKAEGAFHEVKGKVKEVAGKLSDNPKLEAEGTGEKIAGKVQGKLARSRRCWGSSGTRQEIFIFRICRREGKNEKDTFWNNAFGVGTCDPCSNDGGSRCRREHFSASTHRIFRASRGRRDTRDVCLCCP